jgi:hypothetical protein
LIAGVVRDDTGAPVEGARVYFTDAPVPVPDVAAETGADGRFALGAPAAGTYTVECRADGFTVARATVTKSADAAPPVILTLRAL